MPRLTRRIGTLTFALILTLTLTPLPPQSGLPWIFATNVSTPTWPPPNSSLAHDQFLIPPGGFGPDDYFADGGAWIDDQTFLIGGSSRGVVEFRYKDDTERFQPVTEFESPGGFQFGIMIAYSVRYRVALIGSPYPSATHGGRVYAYQYDPQADSTQRWTLFQELVGAPSDRTDRFGEEISVHGNMALVTLPPSPSHFLIFLCHYTPYPSFIIITFFLSLIPNFPKSP